MIRPSLINGILLGTFALSLCVISTVGLAEENVLTTDEVKKLLLQDGHYTNGRNIAALGNRVVPALTEILWNTETDKRLEGLLLGRAMTVISLLEVDTNQFVEPLIFVTRNENYGKWTKISAVIALGNIAGIEIQEDIFTLLNDEEEFIRSNSMRTLGKIGDPSTARRIRKILDKKSEGLSEEEMRRDYTFREGEKAIEEIEGRTRNKEEQETEQGIETGKKDPDHLSEQKKVRHSEKTVETQRTPKYTPQEPDDAPEHRLELSTQLILSAGVTASHSDDITLASAKVSYVEPVHLGERAKMKGSGEIIHSSSREAEKIELNELVRELAPALARTVRNMFISSGLFSISSLLIVFFAKKAWRLDIRVWLIACAGIAVAIIGCARLVLEVDFIHTHLNPFIQISCLLLWSLIFAVCGYGWRRGLLLSLLVSFSYSLWIGVYECFL